MESLLALIPLAAVALYFWMYPHQWTKAMDDIRNALGGGPPSSTA